MQPDRASSAKRVLIAAGTALAALAAVFAIRLVSFDNDISVMLPRNNEIARTFRFFREAPFSSNVFVSFELKEGARRDLIQAVDEFAAKMQSPLIRRVSLGGGAGNAIEDLKELSRLAPQLTGEARLKQIGEELTPEKVRDHLKEVYRLCLGPAGSFMLPVVLADPLGFHTETLRSFRELISRSDYNVQLLDGHLLSADEKHAMAIIETTVPVTDGKGARELMEFLEKRRRELPSNVSADFVSGHLHSISNETTVKHDILITTTVTSVVFLLIFIFLFRDIRALLLFITPSISVLISIPLCALIFGKLSYIILGMGAVISGIAVDYCIHVYIAMQSGQARAAAVKEIAKPVISGALTTAGAFAVFLFSGVPGYQQLAAFTVISTFLSLVLALLIFPYFLNPSAHGVGARQREFLKHIPSSLDKTVTIGWFCLLAVCAFLVPHVHFRMDVKQYDGSRAEVLAAEEKFHQVWGGNARPAALVVETDTFEQALEAERNVRPEVISALGEKSYTALSSVWPSESERRASMERWNAYWTDARVQQLRETLKAESVPFKFSDTAFEPFLQKIRMTPEDLDAFGRIGLLQQVRQRFAFETSRGWQLAALFPDDVKNVAAVRAAVAGKPQFSVISAQSFEKILSQKTLSEAFWFSMAIAVILPLLAFLFLKNVRQVLISLIPVISSLLCILAMLAIFRLNLNVASLLALMVVGGFSIDYGTFMIHQHEHELKTNTALGVTLSALTAFCGAGALLFARHPVLFTYGSSMVCGVAAGYLSAIFVVPAVYRLTQKKITPAAL